MPTFPYAFVSMQFPELGPDKWSVAGPEDWQARILHIMDHLSNFPVKFSGHKNKVYTTLAICKRQP